MFNYRKDSLRYLVGQGLAIRGHYELEGNLQKLIKLLSNNCKNCVLGKWILDEKYLSHDIINELIRKMYLECHNCLLNLIRRAPIYAISVVETRDVSKSIKAVHENYTAIFDTLEEIVFEGGKMRLSKKFQVYLLK